MKRKVTPLTGEKKQTSIATLLNKAKTPDEKIRSLADNVLGVIAPTVTLEPSKDASPIERIASNPIVVHFNRQTMAYKKHTDKTWLDSHGTDKDSEKGRALLRTYRSHERALAKANRDMKLKGTHEWSTNKYTIHRADKNGNRNVSTGFKINIDRDSAAWAIKSKDEWNASLLTCSLYDLAVLCIARRLTSSDLAFIRSKNPPYFMGDPGTDSGRWDSKATSDRIVSLAKRIQDSPSYEDELKNEYDAKEEAKNEERAAKLAANAAKAREAKAAKAKAQGKAKANTASKKRTQAEKDASLLREAATVSQVSRTLAKAAAIAAGEKKQAARAKRASKKAAA